MKPKVLVTRTLPGGALDALASEAEITLREGDLPPNHEEMRRQAAGQDGLLTLLTDPVDAAVLDASPRLKVVSNYAVGVDNIDVTSATARGIPVGHTPGVLTETTADLAFALMVSAARRIVEGAQLSREGRYLAWSPTLLLGPDLHGATLGIVGFGRIGRAMARRALGFDMRVLFCDPGPLEAPRGSQQVDMETLLAESDFVSIHTPLTEETRGLFGAEAFAKMKPDALLINTARGPVVDHDALYVALRDGQLGGAALDVTEPEPLPTSSPLFELDNCLIVPHLGSASVATRARMAQMSVANLIAGLEGRPLPHCVNPQVYTDRTETST
jgi:glyoxylate reductase